MMTRRGLAWIAEAAEDPHRCREMWADDPRRPYTMPAGRRFDVLVLGQRVGVETFDQLERHGMPVGPVMADWASQQVGFFLPNGSRSRFGRMVHVETSTPPAYRYLGVGSTVTVPGPVPLSGDRFVWLRAPIAPLNRSPARTAALAAMFVAAFGLVSRADRYGQERQLRNAVRALRTGEQEGKPSGDW